MKRLLAAAVFLIPGFCAQAQAWIELGTGRRALNANFTIHALMTDPAGHVYAAGGFTDSATYISGTSYVAMWTDSNWVPLGRGDSALNANNSIYALAQDAAGNIYAAGNFTDINGRQYVAKWNGAFWSELGIDTIGLNALARIYTVSTDAAGNVYCAGAFTDLFFAYNHYYVAEWNPATNRWTEVGIDSFGNGGIKADSIIYATAFDRHGNLYAAGAFTDSLGYSYVARWDGSRWSRLENDSSRLNANGQINAMLVDSAGNVYVGGQFTDSLGYFAMMKWNGSRWVELSNPAADQTVINGYINGLALDSVGNVYAGGMFTDTSGNFYYVVVWNGGQLLVADNSGSAPLEANNFIVAMASDRSGNIYAAGAFTDANNYQFVAEFTGNIPSGVAGVAPAHFSLWPNPAGGMLQIKADGLSGNSTVSICDALGRPVYTGSTEGSTISLGVDVSVFSSGLYLLQLSDAAGHRVVQRFVKE